MDAKYIERMLLWAREAADSSRFRRYMAKRPIRIELEGMDGDSAYITCRAFLANPKRESDKQPFAETYFRR